MWIPILMAILLLSGVGVHKYMGKNDSIPEQMIERVLKVEGINIDFSEESKGKEQDNNIKQK